MSKSFTAFLLSCFLLPSAGAGFIDSRDQENSGKPAAVMPRLPGAMPTTQPASKGSSVAAAAPKAGESEAKRIEAPLAVETALKKDELKPLVLLPGSRLSHSIRSWLEGRSITLSWEAQGQTSGLVRDFEVESHWSSRSADLEASLAEVLPSFGLTAEILRAPGAPAGTAEMVMIRNGSAPRP